MTVYAMSYMPGQCWFRMPMSNVQARVEIAESIGTILGHGLTEGRSIEVVESTILPCLKRFRDGIDEKTKPLRPHVERLIAASAGLKKLPLYFSHHDLNETNVLVSEHNTVSGIVDWGCAKDLPFGMGFHRITDTIVARNSLGVIKIPDGSREAEEAFWTAVLRNASTVILENLEDVQNAVQIGSLIFAITEKHLEGPNPSTSFLSALLTYRIPQLRGDTSPFAQEYMSS